MDNTTEVVEKKKKTGKQKTILGLKIAFNIVFYALILLVLIFSISNIRAKNKSDQIPNIFGKGYLTVSSDSMTGSEKDSFKKGDLIIVDIASEKEKNKLEVGDIITFYDPDLTEKGVSKQLNTHRIVYIAQTTDGSRYYYTVGDKIREQIDNLAGSTVWDYKGNDFQSKTAEEAESFLISRFGSSNVQMSNNSTIRGIYSSKISGFGKTIDTINDKFLLIVVLPVIIFLLIEIAIFVYNLMLVKTEKNRLASANQTPVIDQDEKERLKEQLRQELLNEFKKEQSEEKDKKEE